MPGVGIIGCGGITVTYLKALKEIEGVRIVAMSCRNAAKAREIVKAHECDAEVYDKEEDLLARGEIDVVCICTPSGLHGASAIKAAQAGKHVIVEKPIEIALDQIERMIQACDENGVRLAGIFNNRYKEGHRFVKQAVSQGRLGRLINANVHIRWYRKPEYYLSSLWKGTWALDGGGALMNQGIHYIDLLQWYIGDIEKICAYTGTLLHRSIETEDTAVAIFESRSGILGSIVAGTSIYPGFAPKIELTGERGSLTVSGGFLQSWDFIDEDPLDETARAMMVKKTDDGTASDPMALDHASHKNQLMHIFHAIEHRLPMEIDGAEASKSVKIIRAIYDSAAQRKEIRL